MFTENEVYLFHQIIIEILNAKRVKRSKEKDHLIGDKWGISIKY